MTFLRRNKISCKLTASPKLAEFTHTDAVRRLFSLSAQAQGIHECDRRHRCRVLPVEHRRCRCVVGLGEIRIAGVPQLANVRLSRRDLSDQPLIAGGIRRQVGADAARSSGVGRSRPAERPGAACGLGDRGCGGDLRESRCGFHGGFPGGRAGRARVAGRHAAARRRKSAADRTELSWCPQFSLADECFARGEGDASGRADCLRVAKRCVRQRRHGRARRSADRHVEARQRRQYGRSQSCADLPLPQG